MTIDVAVFGAGRIGKIHAANLAKQPGVRLKYVVDVNKEAAASHWPRFTARKWPMWKAHSATHR
jgi:predicted dehydrogenase